MGTFLDTADAFLASFSPAERAVARHAFLGILGGRPVACADFAPPLGLAPAESDAAIARHLERGTMAVEEGRVVAARGLSLPPTPHALDIDGRRLHAFCAVDAVGIPIAIPSARRARIPDRSSASFARSSMRRSGKRRRRGRGACSR